MTTNAKTSCGAAVTYDYGSKQAACSSTLGSGVTLQCGACRARDGASSDVAEEPARQVSGDAELDAAEAE